MNDILLKKSKLKNNQEIIISGSKSETNRLLLLQAFYPSLKIENASNSDDSNVMLTCLKSNSLTKDVHHAGTAMRFLTAYFAIKDGEEVVLTGSDRMKNRPIKILVDALRQLDATISYLDKEGFPPLQIIGKKIIKSRVEIDANVSSQYITSLLLIGSSLPNGIEIHLKGTITSLPYINMSISLLQTLGIQVQFQDNILKVPKTEILTLDSFVVESDWSSASYFYSMIALSPVGTRINLGYFKENSFQGDAVLTKIYKSFGVQTTFINNKIVLEKNENHSIKKLNLDLNNTPDLAQTIIVTCLALGIKCDLTGLHTLKIKETDRLQALKNELEKFGATVSITNNSIQLQNTVTFNKEFIKIETYQDHRMALAFAPLALKQPVLILNAQVVSKSYPHFWNDLNTIGFSVNLL